MTTNDHKFFFFKQSHCAIIIPPPPPPPGFPPVDQPPFPSHGAAGCVRNWCLRGSPRCSVPPTGTGQESHGQSHTITASMCLKAATPSHRSEVQAPLYNVKAFHTFPVCPRLLPITCINVTYTFFFIFKLSCTLNLKMSVSLILY